MEVFKKNKIYTILLVLGLFLLGIGSYYTYKEFNTNNLQNSNNNNDKDNNSDNDNNSDDNNVNNDNENNDDNQEDNNNNDDNEYQENNHLSKGIQVFKKSDDEYEIKEIYANQEFIQGNNLVKTIIFENRDAKLLDINQFADGFIYYDEKIILYDILNNEKIIFKTKYNDEYIYKLSGYFHNIERDSDNKIIGVSICYNDNNYNSYDDMHLHDYIIYYDKKTKKEVLLNASYVKRTNDNNYLMLTSGFSQFYQRYFKSVYDIKQEKIIYTHTDDNDGEFDDFLVLTINNKKYFAVKNNPYLLLDQNMKVINIIDTYNSDLVNINLQTGNYVYAKNGSIVECTIEGKELKSSKKYDRILGVSPIYSVIEKDGYEFLIKNDGTFQRKLKKEEYYNTYDIVYNQEKELVYISHNYRMSITYGDIKYVVDLKKDSVTICDELPSGCYME